MTVEPREVDAEITLKDEKTGEETGSTLLDFIRNNEPETVAEVLTQCREGDTATIGGGAEPVTYVLWRMPK